MPRLTPTIIPTSVTWIETGNFSTKYTSAGMVMISNVSPPPMPRIETALSPAAEAQAAVAAEALRHRAPVFLRVNILRTSRDAAQAALGN